MSRQGFVIFIFSALFIFIISCVLISSYQEKLSNDEVVAEKLYNNSCSGNWKLCKNLHQLIEENKNINRYRYECKSVAEDTMRFGPPEWESFPYESFSSYYKSSPFLKTGYIVLIEQNALVPNQFGGKERTQLDCFVDLQNNRVDRVEIFQP